MDPTQRWFCPATVIRKAPCQHMCGLGTNAFGRVSMSPGGLSHLRRRAARPYGPPGASRAIFVTVIRSFASAELTRPRTWASAVGWSTDRIRD